ncbi:putative pectinesterase/pectinesterase inhibitor 7 [Prunus yedoensis var. nudiflora]|uniref:pectinesterase n=1 Tax=Prunus yedoensis var. nudiflora TaxID=2094558 RepID=A0A314Y6C2_PRUYE|nr:putative pectinesterase/pectinesterase inhibitor 7 [Prunus yedoensis var. nudiflora]
MAYSKLIVASFFILVPLFASLSLAADNSSTPVSAGTICKSTPDPSFCKSVLPHNQTAGNVYYYGRFSVRKSLSQSRKFLNLVDKYLKRRSSLSLTAVRALEDCRLLAGLNMDFLLNSFEMVNKTNTLSNLKADDVQTSLSAILTNQQTCLDGIQSTAAAWSLKTGLSAPNDTKFYSVSLALFTKGWVPKKKMSKTWKPTRKQRGFKNGRLPLKMSSRTRAVYEGITKRKMLQTETEDDGVLVSEVVTVSQNGTGNFSTINDAIAAAPNNSASTDGYFLIYVTAGVYEEYVSIAKNKKYLMMVGDGINQTILTGNRSVVDGWTTFNSATFAVTAPGFVAVNMTFRNTAGAIKHQAVAVRNGADLSTFYSCSFEAVVDPAGWRAWDGEFALSTLYYAEYNNTGPGSNTTSRVTWPGYHVINATDAANFTVTNFLLGDDWLPQTGVPYTGGLI